MNMTSLNRIMTFAVFVPGGSFLAAARASAFTTRKACWLPRSTLRDRGLHRPGSAACESPVRANAIGKVNPSSWISPMQRRALCSSLRARSGVRATKPVSATAPVPGSGRSTLRGLTRFPTQFGFAGSTTRL
jgi:hypothetical protein